ncbi:hypothetical protein pb186bvf_000199 [Paramecium bursaria]
MSNTPLQRFSSKRRTKIDDFKQFSFYNTFVNRKDIIQLANLNNEIDQKNYLIRVIKRFEDAHQLKTGFPFAVYQLITFEYYNAQTISKATEESQLLCKHNIFSEYLLTIYKKFQQHTFEQKSIFLSIGFYIFVESLERKITQIDSYELFKKILRPQILLTNAYTTPVLTQEQIIEFNNFMTKYFFRYYSLYELRMTTYQEVNIEGKFKNEAQSQLDIGGDQDSIQEEDEVEVFDLDQEDQQDIQIQSPKKIDEQDEKHIDQMLQSFKLNWNNRLEG